METKDNEVKVKTQRVLRDPFLAPETAGHFAFTRVGEDTQMDVGFFDLNDMKAALDSAREGGEAATQFFVTHRFVLSRRALEVLARNATEILQRMNAAESTEEGEA